MLADCRKTLTTLSPRDPSKEAVLSPSRPDLSETSPLAPSLWGVVDTFPSLFTKAKMMTLQKAGYHFHFLATPPTKDSPADNSGHTPIIESCTCNRLIQDKPAFTRN